MSKHKFSLARHDPVGHEKVLRT